MLNEVKHLGSGDEMLWTDLRESSATAATSPSEAKAFWLPQKSPINGAKNDGFIDS